MSSKAQQEIWSFITEFKHATGKDLPYLQLVQSEADMLNAIQVALKQNHLPLNQVAHSLLHLIKTGQIPFRSKIASNPKPNPPMAASRASQVTTASKPKSIDQTANLSYYNMLIKKALSDAEISIIQREELDHVCRRKNIAPEAAEAVENRVRGEMGLDPVDWELEARNSTHRFINLHGELTEIDRVLLYNTYIKTERLPPTSMEQIIKRELASVTNNSLGDVNRGLLAIGAVVLVLVIAVVSLFVRDSSVPPAQTLANSGEIDNPLEVHVSDPITEDTLWKAETTYYLTAPIYVEGRARLTIEPGTRIFGEFGSALIVTRDAELYARGQKNAPIVFTSAKAPGDRQRGDWGGVVLLGNASINRPTGFIEGVPRDDIRGRFGGLDDDSSCGIVEYTRIEFAGFEVFQDNELNGLTLGGCGRNTIVRHVQVHMAADDGVEMFGGLADLKHVVITGAKDDSLDWDMGWRGRVQFLVIQQYDDAGDNGFEADNWGKNHNAEPRSNPTMYNITLIGSRNPDSGQRAMNLRRGTAGEFYNFIVFGHSKEFLDIRDEVTANLARRGDITFSHGLVYGIGLDGRRYFASELDEKSNDDNGLIEANYIASQNQVILGENPKMPRAQDLIAPDYTPAIDSLAAMAFSAQPQEEFWDESANYMGALRPGEQNSWLSGWTQFDTN